MNAHLESRPRASSDRVHVLQLGPAGDRYGVEDKPVQDAVLDAIDPTQYESSDATPPVVATILPDTTSWMFEQRLAVLLFNLARPRSQPLS